MRGNHTHSFTSVPRNFRPHLHHLNPPQPPPRPHLVSTNLAWLVNHLLIDSLYAVLLPRGQMADDGWGRGGAVVADVAV
jgi:hypothetical protein